MKRSAIVQEIMKNYEKKRRNAERKRDEKVAAIYQRIPQLESLEKEMTRKSLSMTRSLLAAPEDQEALLSQLQKELETMRNNRLDLMARHGVRETDFEPHWSCSKCMDRGILKDGSHCSCFKQQLINEAYEMSNLSGILEKENFKTFQLNLFSPETDSSEGVSQKENMLQILNECEGFAFNFDLPEEKNLLFFGPTGLGKTFMANCIAKALLDRGRIVIYQTAIKLISLLEIHQFGKEGRETDPQTLDRLFSCDLLIIDDLGTELSNTFTNSQLFQIINTRQLEGRKTLISTNLPPSTLMERYDDRICSRIFAHYNFVKFFGKDVRWEKAKKE